MPKPATHRRHRASRRSLGDLLGAGRVVGIGPVADGLDRREDVGELDAALVPAHAGTPGGVVDVDRRDAGLVGHVLFVEPDAGRTGYSLKEQRRFALAFPQLLDEALLEIGVIVQRQLLEDGRHRLARRFRQRISAAVIVREAVGDDRLRYRLAPVTAHRAFFSTHRDRQFEIIRNRLATVITGSFRHAKEKRRRSAFPVQEAEPQYRLFGSHADGAVEADHLAIQVGILRDVPDQRREFGRPAHA